MAKAKKKEVKAEVKQLIGHELLLEKLKEAHSIAEQLKGKIRLNQVMAYRSTIIRASTDLNNIIRRFK